MRFLEIKVYLCGQLLEADAEGRIPLPRNASHRAACIADWWKDIEQALLKFPRGSEVEIGVYLETSDDPGDTHYSQYEMTFLMAEQRPERLRFRYTALGAVANGRLWS
jgi:hypothetical protein